MCVGQNWSDKLLVDCYGLLEKSVIGVCDYSWDVQSAFGFDVYCVAVFSERKQWVCVTSRSVGLRVTEMGVLQRVLMHVQLCCYEIICIGTV